MKRVSTCAQRDEALRSSATDVAVLKLERLLADLAAIEVKYDLERERLAVSAIPEIDREAAFAQISERQAAEAAPFAADISRLEEIMRASKPGTLSDRQSARKSAGRSSQSAESPSKARQSKPRRMRLTKVRQDASKS